MVIEWQVVARVVAVVVMALAAYFIGRQRGRQEGFMAAIFSIATDNIDVNMLDVDDLDKDELGELLRMMGEDDGE